MMKGHCEIGIKVCGNESWTLEIRHRIAVARYGWFDLQTTYIIYIRPTSHLA